jgi:hypothetical protein
MLGATLCGMQVFYNCSSGILRGMWFLHLRGQFFCPEDGSSTFLENGGSDEVDCGITFQMTAIFRVAISSDMWYHEVACFFSSAENPHLEYCGPSPGFHTDEEVTVINVYKTLLKDSRHTAVLDMAGKVAYSAGAVTSNMLIFILLTYLFTELSPS